MASVAWISIAPVKGLRLVDLERVELQRGGVAANRAFHLVDAEGRLVNGKRMPKLMQVIAGYDPAAGELRLTFPDGAQVAAEVALGEQLATRFFSRLAAARRVEGPWSQALSEWAGAPLTLVAFADGATSVDRGPAAAASLLSTASLRALASAGGVDGEIDHRRFRMLLGVDGVEPFEEDGWVGRVVRIGGAAVRFDGNVGRCTVTSCEPASGTPDLDTLALLREHRAGTRSSEPLPLGVYGEIVEPGTVRLGDPVVA